MKVEYRVCQLFKTLPGLHLSGGVRVIPFLKVLLKKTYNVRMFVPKSRFFAIVVFH